MSACNHVRIVLTICTGALYYVQYHKAQDLPNNFVALGDAGMKVNPVFGCVMARTLLLPASINNKTFACSQGLTKAMVGAICLNSRLQREGSELSKSFSSSYHNLLHNKLTNTWDMTRFVDYTLDTTDPAANETNASGANLRWLFKRLDELEIAGVSRSSHPLELETNFS